jgi:hypothetical protein
VLFSETVINQETSTFDVAWNHEDPTARGKWRNTIKMELCDMNKQQI